jgi:hypothetical protein
MAERSFRAEVKKLTVGEGEIFTGEGILAVTKGLLQSGVAYVGGYQGSPISHLMDVFADASDLPVMVYDIPGRSGIAIARETYLRIAEHERIAAVKDARGDLWFASEMMQETGLDWYSGDDAMNLGHFVNGAVGFEYFVHPVVPLRVGLFTDFSPTPLPTVDPSGSSEDHVDSLGATFSVGITTPTASTTFGLVATHGWASLIGIDLSQATYQIFPTTGSQWKLYFVWSSSYRY